MHINIEEARNGLLILSASLAGPADRFVRKSFAADAGCGCWFCRATDVYFLKGGGVGEFMMRKEKSQRNEKGAGYGRNR